MRDTGNLAYLELAAKGVFHEYDSSQQSYGQWFINQADSSLNLRFEVRNNLLITRKTKPEAKRQQYKLVKMSKDSLILETQGRHGMLVITYLPAPNQPQEEE